MQILLQTIGLSLYPSLYYFLLEDFKEIATIEPEEENPELEETKLS
jgi:hypothetical protein